jgi:uncharacterized protein YdiU (UPF0061 family)
MTTLNWRFDNSYTRMPESLFSRLAPTPVRQPALVIFNRALARSLGLGLDGVAEGDLARLFAGNALPEGAAPIAQAYAGHQFGYFTMLGDGRAIVLGEHLTPAGQRFDIQLKGSGRTPYSRSGDGRAALGPMLREYVVSEAMHALGIPTSRSLAVVTTGEPVYREDVLTGAILTRVAASHLRVGTFQYVAATGAVAALRTLLDYAIARHYPDAAGAANPALAFLGAVIERQAELIVDWMRVGFIHGVMNTDNMTISGETIDYGPCAFMNGYDPATVFSSIDRDGRYAFGNQPPIAQWNLAKLASALLSLIHDDEKQAIEAAQAQIHAFKDVYEARWTAMMRRKLGLFGAEPEDAALIDDLLGWMHENKADYTNTFRALANGVAPTGGDLFNAWQARLQRQAEPREAALALMRAANPAYIPRNHQVEAALTAATEQADLQPLHKLLAALAEPYTEREDLSEYQAPQPDDRLYRTFCGT